LNLTQLEHQYNSKWNLIIVNSQSKEKKQWEQNLRKVNKRSSTLFLMLIKSLLKDLKINTEKKIKTIILLYFL
jgi:hypothetical protein